MPPDLTEREFLAALRRNGMRRTYGDFVADDVARLVIYAGPPAGTFRRRLATAIHNRGFLTAAAPIPRNQGMAESARQRAVELYSTASDLAREVGSAATVVAAMRNGAASASDLAQLELTLRSAAALAGVLRRSCDANGAGRVKRDGRFDSRRGNDHNAE